MAVAKTSSESNSTVAVNSLRLLSVKELCELLGVSRSKVYVEMASRRLRCIKLGGSTRFRLADVEAYLNGLDA
ncbi:helix-turn-helix transcriptional regulator [Methylocella sp.]|uniref:helix-turn-helix transcriptional regulator n=1 Tax=Methylocella sp. TaxID=1978226 RepID=UPI0035AF2E5D